MFELLNDALPIHKYYLFSTKTDLKDGTYSSRKGAEIAMNNYCSKHGIQVTCIEQDKHERVYLGTNGSQFYINRI